jgi:hypothetical protein
MTSLLKSCRACSANGFSEQLGSLRTGVVITTNDCHIFSKAFELVERPRGSTLFEPHGFAWWELFIEIWNQAPSSWQRNRSGSYLWFWTKSTFFGWEHPDATPRDSAIHGARNVYWRRLRFRKLIFSPLDWLRISFWRPTRFLDRTSVRYKSRAESWQMNDRIFRMTFQHSWNPWFRVAGRQIEQLGSHRRNCLRFWTRVNSN